MSACLLERARSVDLKLDAKLVYAIGEGFPEGDDAFDAVIGLFGMTAVVVGMREAGEPSEDRIRNVEGWILGQVPRK